MRAWRRILRAPAGRGHLPGISAYRGSARHRRRSPRHDAAPAATTTFTRAEPASATSCARRSTSSEHSHLLQRTVDHLDADRSLTDRGGHALDAGRARVTDTEN